MLKKLVDTASESNNVKGALADGMYDTNKNFRYLSKNHIKPDIKTRSNSKIRPTKDPYFHCHIKKVPLPLPSTRIL